MVRLIAKIVYLALLLVETLISIRLIFTFIQANTTNDIVSKVLSFSEYFVNPFNGIVADSVRIGNFVIDTTALLALIVYMILAFIAVELVKAFAPAPADH